METYKNLRGDSGVAAYEILDGAIRVHFKDAAVYEYTSQSAGVQNIITMQTLASRGRGLNSFINTHVKKLYSAKVR